MLVGQFLAIFTLHDRLVLIVRIQREVVQISEWIKHKLSLPLDWEIVLVGDRIGRPLEKVRLELGIGNAYKSGEALVPTTLIDGEDEVDGGLLAAPIGICQATSGSDRSRPDSVLNRDLNRL